MLEFMRRFASSIIMKALLVLLIISFGVWGIGDIFRGRSNEVPVATVGEAEISPAYFRAEFQREVQRLSQMLGQNITQDQALQMGLDGMLVSRLVNTEIMQQGARSLGMLVSDKVVLDEIHANPEFKNKNGQFDPRVFQTLLSQNRLSEDAYVAMVKADIARAQFLSPIRDGAQPPKGLLDALYLRLAETRVMDAVRINHANLKNVPVPTDDDLNAYLQANAANFMAPEYRALTAIVLSADVLGQDLEVSADKLQDAYDQRVDLYTTPEKRKLSQVLVTNEADAQRAAELLAAGKALAEVVTEVGANPALITVGTFTRVDAANLTPELADAAFAAPLGGHTQPLQSPLGWHVLQIDAIEPGQVQSLDDVKDELLKELRAEQALNLVFETSNRLEDLLGGGMTFEEAAHELGVAPTIIAAVDARGLAPDGQPVTGAYIKDITAQGFKTAPGEDSPMTEAQDGKAFFIVRVDEATAPALRPLNTVKKVVALAWSADKRSELAAAAATEVKSRLEAGEDAAAIAQSMGFEAFTTTPFNRLGKGLEQGALPVAVIDQAFSLRVGQVAEAEGTGAHTVARLKSVTPGTLDTQADLYKQIVQRTRQDVQADLATQLSAALQVRFPVHVNVNALSAMSGTN